MEDGDFSPVHESGFIHDLLMDIKTGKYEENGQLTQSYFDIYHTFDHEAEQAYRATSLPDRSQRGKLMELLEKVNLQVIEHGITGKASVFGSGQ